MRGLNKPETHGVYGASLHSKPKCANVSTWKNGAPSLASREFTKSAILVESNELVHGRTGECENRIFANLKKNWSPRVEKPISASCSRRIEGVRIIKFIAWY